MKNIYIIAVVGIFVITSLLTSCSVKETNNTVSLNIDNVSATEKVNDTTDQLVDKTQETRLPDIIELQYKEIKSDSILQAGDLTLLKKVKVEQLGKVDGEQINISLYSDKDNNIHGVFKHKDKEYVLNYLGYAHDLESIKIHGLQLVYNTNGKNIVLVSGIGSSILGYQYILFDESSSKWSSFHNWGTPQVLDINHDGIKEVFLQFHGMHLHTPDLNIFSFQNGRLMVTEINSEVYRNVKLDINKSKISSTYIKEQENKVLVEISDISGNEAPFLYHLEYDELDSSLLRLRKEIQNSQMVDESKKTSVDNYFDATKYNGKWISTDYQIVQMDGYKAPFGSELYLKYKNDGIIEMNMYDISSPPANRVATIEIEVKISPEGMGRFTFDNDGWGSHGSGTIELNDGQVIINIDSQVEQDNYPDWRIYSGKRVFIKENISPDGA